MIEDEVILDFDVVCHQPTCGNRDAVIRIGSVDENPFVVCGPCSVQITDVTKISSE